MRLDTLISPQGAQWLSYGAALILAIPLFISFGLYRAVFRYAGWAALMAVVRACAVYGVIYSAIFTVVGVASVPRTIGLIQPVLLFLAIGASRALARYWLGGGYLSLLRLGDQRRVLIYGAGSAGRKLAAALSRGGEMDVVGYIDDDDTLQGSVLNGKTIFPPTSLAKLFERLEIDDVLLALPSASRRRRNEIIQEIRATPVSIRTLPGLADLARAARFIYIQWTSFGRRVHKPTFGVSRTNPARFDLTKLASTLEDVHERLCGVDIECLPDADFISKYDTPGTLFYIDPPYFGNEDDYGLGVFSRDDFGLLRSLLDGIQGRFILSINDHPVVRDKFAGFAIEEVKLNYQVSGKATPARELIISG